MSTAFQRITALLDQIAMEKSGKHEIEPSVKDKVGEARTGAFASDDNAMIDKTNMRQPKYGQEGQLAAKHGQPRWAGTFTGTDPENENSKHIYDLTIDFRKYVNKTAAANVPTEELLRDAATLGNSLLAEILQEDQINQGNDPYGAVKTAANVQQAQSSQPTAFWSDSPAPQAATWQSSGATVDPLQVIGLSGGVVYGLQKQAEYHADLVAQYLYGELYKKYAADDKALEEAVRNLSGDEAPSEADEAAESQSDQDEAVADEEAEAQAKKKEKSDTKRLMSTVEDEADEGSEEESEEDSEEDKAETEEPGDAAGKALADQVAEDAVNESLSDDDIMNSLGAALAELGLSPEELGQLGGVAGQKLASAFDNFRRKGGFRLEPARTKVKRAARDYIKGYILDLIRPGRA